MSPPRYEPVRCPCQHRYVPYNRSTRYCLFHLMCIRILLLLTVFGRRWCGNDGGIHYRSLFQNEASFHKCGNHLREQLFLQSVLDQQIAKTAKGIAVWTLIAGIDAAEIRKRTAVDCFCCRIGGENRWTLYEKSVFYFSIPKEKNCTFVSYINKD